MRKRTDRRTFIFLFLLIATQLTAIWNQSGLIRGNFRYCLRPFEIRYGLENVVLMSLCFTLILNFHHFCSQLFNFSIHGHLQTDRQNTTKKIITLIILTASLSCLTIWVILVLTYDPKYADDIATLQRRSSYASTFFLMLMAVYIIYCLVLLKKAQAEPVQAVQWYEIRVSNIFLAMASLLVVMCCLQTALYWSTELWVRLPIMTLDYLGFFTIKVLLFMIIRKFSGELTITSEIIGNFIHMAAVNASGHE